VTFTPRGSTNRLKRIFPVLDEKKVSRILEDDDYVSEFERHQDFFDALGIPTGPAIVDFKYLQKGELPDGLSDADLVRIGI
jgi:hypothetical protein